MPPWFDNAALAARLCIMLNGAAMIIACPACTTRYVVPDSAIGIDGRTVRCAKCRHSWFQEGPLPDIVAPALAPAIPRAEPSPAPHVEPQASPPPPLSPSAPAPATAARVSEHNFAERTSWPGAETSQPVAEPVAPPATDETLPPEPTLASPPPPEPTFVQEPPVQPAFADDRGWSDYQDADSSFAHEPPFRPRRNMLKIWTWAAAGFAFLTLSATATVAWYGLPDWMPLARQTFAAAQPDLVLDFPPNRQDRRTLPNGTEFFGASGTVTNVGTARRTVPTILIVLRDANERIVYSWEVAPPKAELAPGESVSINEAVTDVPKTAKFAEIGWKPS